MLDHDRKIEYEKKVRTLLREKQYAKGKLIL